MTDPADAVGRQPDWGWACLVAGGLALLWSIAILSPPGAWLPSWPAASAGALALAAARLPGRAWTRGLGAFLGVVGITVGVAKILALWGLLEFLTGA